MARRAGQVRPAGAREPDVIQGEDPAGEQDTRLRQEAAEQVERNAAALRRYGLPLFAEPACIFRP